MSRISVAAALLLAACATQSGMTPHQTSQQRALAEARPIGPPQDCVPLSRIRDSQVLDSRTIDFHLIGGSVFRSRLPHECPGLAFEERFAYRTSIDQLCSVDTITVLHTDGIPGPLCRLGPFQPVEFPER